MKKRKRWILWFMTVALLMGSVCSCIQERDGLETADPLNQGNITEQDLGELVNIIENKKTDYVIVYNPDDPFGKFMATELSNLFHKELKASVPIRVDTKENAYEIAVGSTVRAESAAAAQKLKNDNDFFIGKNGDRIVMYANSSYAYKRLLITVRDVYCNAEAKNFSLREREAYLMSENGTDLDNMGTSVCLFADGATPFTIVYAAGNSKEAGVGDCLAWAFKEYAGINIKVKNDFTAADSEAYEILIGVGTTLPNREEAKAEVRHCTAASNEFLLTLSGHKILLFANSIQGLVTGADYFVQNYVQNAQDNISYFSELNEHWNSMCDPVFESEYETLKSVYINFLRTYPTIYEEMKVSSSISGDSKRDQKLIEAMIPRMGGSAVFYVGSSSVLYDGFIQKLDKQDYSRVATEKDGSLWIPAEFANTYFGTSYGLQETVDLMALASEKGYGFYLDRSTGLAIVSPAGVAPFGDDDASSNGYTNLQYRQRMIAFFNNPQMPEPSNNTEQSRVVVDTQYDYPEEALDYNAYTYKNCYSPSILAVTQNGQSVLYAAYEVTVCERGVNEVDATTFVKVSRDGGLTWETLTSVRGLKMASLFNVGETVYMVGSAFKVGEWHHIHRKDVFLTLYRFQEGGTYESVVLDGITVSDIFKVQIINDVLYMAKNNHIISCSVNEDLMNPTNWVVTETDLADLITVSWFEQLTGKKLTGNMSAIEGCMVEGPDGSVYGVYRVECHPYANYAVMVKVSADRKTLSLLPNGGSLINLPTTVSRFVIEYDEVSGYYVCISNLWTLPEGKNCHRARNVLGLSVSRDLVNWTVVDSILVDREMMNSEFSVWAHGFQYTDFDFDGEDIVLLVREATGYANTFHDGKYCTFYRLTNFRDLIAEKLG